MTSGWLSWFWASRLFWVAAVVGCVGGIGDRTFAQITPDGTLGEERSVVTPEVIRGKPSDRIDGGATRGANLFHSFREFNVGEGRGAYFSNPSEIENIFSRVTGGSRSNILGTLGVLGEANLFLINPNGILFGPNASLDVEGSFVGTTANGIRFGEQGFFSATNPNIPSQLLTVNPSAFFFNQINGGLIENRSVASAGQRPSGFEAIGLRVSDGQSLLLVGGDVKIDGGSLNAFGGRIELGGLAQAGAIDLGIEENILSLKFPEGVARANVSLSNGALIDVRAGGGGSIGINAQNVDVSGESFLAAGIGQNLGVPDAQAGDVEINAAGAIKVRDGSLVFNTVQREAVGNAGDINLAADSLLITNGAQLVTSTFGQGDAGNIVLTIEGALSLGRQGQPDSSANIVSNIENGGNGRGGTIEIQAQSLSLQSGSQIQTGVRGDNLSTPTPEVPGRGQAGKIVIETQGPIEIDGINSQGLSSGILSILETGAVGAAGDISLTTEGSLSLTNGAQLAASTFGQGDAGSIIINASESVLFEGVDSNGSSSAAFSSVEAGAEGKGGRIEITTGSLSVTDGAQLVAGTRGQGDAGNIVINASESVLFEGVDSNGFSRGAFSSVEEGAEGKGGEIEITTGSLSVTDGAQLAAGTRGQGDAGNIIINANEISFEGVGSDGVSCGAFSSVEEGAEGKGGEIEITTGSLSVTDGAQLAAGTRGQGDAGNIIINANEISFEGVGSDGVSSGAFSSVAEGAEGKGGGIEITTGSLSVTDGARLSSSTFGQGRGGEIQLSSHFLSLTNGARIDSRSFGAENSGDITINVRGTLQADDGEISTSSTQASGGEINITAGDIGLRGDSDIRTEVASGAGGGGNIALTADSILAFDDSDILAFAQDGQGGNITLDTTAFFGSSFQPAPETTDPDTLDGNNRVDVNASGAVSGDISLPDVSFVQNSLTELSESTIDTDTLISNSCVVPSGGQRGTFIITGAGGLPVRPGDASVSPYPTGTVRSVPNEESSLPGTTRLWQKGDPIVEPTGTYRLANGKLVMSRECSR